MGFHTGAFALFSYSLTADMMFIAAVPMQSGVVSGKSACDGAVLVMDSMLVLVCECIVFTFSCATLRAEQWHILLLCFREHCHTNGVKRGLVSNQLS
jgi:hypothetical protein